MIVTTGGTGITSRDSTYEAIASLLDKTARRLRRAVPDAQLRADRLRRDAEPRLRRHRSARTAIFALPGSEHAVRLAMTKLILPELGHVVQGAASDDDDAADSRHDPARRSARAADRRPPCRSSAPSGCPLRDAGGRVLAGDVVVGAATCRRSIARRWTATPSSREDTFGAGRYDAEGRCAASRRSTPAQVPSRARRARRVHRDRDRRADARRRRRGRDGRGNRERATIGDVRDLHAGVSAAARRPARRRHRRRADGARARATC